MIGFNADRHTLVSVDVFDTLLLRDSFSERRRFLRIARAAAVALARAGHPRTLTEVYNSRNLAQAMAYAALRSTGDIGEVSFRDLLGLQLRALGLDDCLASVLAEAELSADCATLRVNAALVRRLGRLRSDGMRVVAVSDTYYSSSDLKRLLSEHGATDALDRIYASADLGATKKSGRLFSLVAAAEGIKVESIFHFGDDLRADYEAPRAQGISAERRARVRPVRWMRKLDAGWLRATPLVSSKDACAAAEQPASFGESILGPILAEFSLRLYLYACALPPDSQLLFCARGGLRLRLYYQRLLAAIGRESPVPFDDLMISRLAAARRPLLAGARAAVEEISREFADASMGGALSALSQEPHEVTAVWAQRFEVGEFLKLLGSRHRSAIAAHQAITEQGALFERHFCERRRARHVVLCDTGLYGSTLRLLQAAHPDVALSCAMFARANYKGFTTEHFTRAVGVSIERDAYSPFDIRSAALRYWQLIEHVCEPELESVRKFTRNETGAVVSNLEKPGWSDALAPDDQGFFAGALSYLDRLAPQNYGQRIAHDAPAAWRELRRRIVWPSRADRALLDVGPRGRDFGRSDNVPALVAGDRFSLASLRTSLWREGVATEAPFGLAPVLQAALETAQIAKQLRRPRTALRIGAASP